MVIMSHDKAFLYQLCTKIVETDMGVSRTYDGNYSNYVIAKSLWKKQQKEIEQTRDLIIKQVKCWSKCRSCFYVQLRRSRKIFIRKQMKIRFPQRGRSGRSVATIKSLDFNYEDKFSKLSMKFAEDRRIDDIKGLLGRYNFKADMVDRKVSFLSGGENV